MYIEKAFRYICKHEICQTANLGVRLNGNTLSELHK